MSSPEVSEVIEIKSLDNFILVLMDWHETKVKELEHLLSIPEGIAVSVNEEPPLTLQGDLHKGFLIGLSVALIELGHLPFISSEEISPEQDDSIH